MPFLAVALSLGACSGDDPAPSSPVRNAGAGPSVYGPIQDVRQAGNDYVTAQTAINARLDAAWAACMKEQGHELAPPTPSREQVLTDGFHIAYGTDIANPAVREKEGYGVTSELVGIPSVYDRENSVTAFAKTLNNAQRTAFDAVLDTCSDRAHSEVLPATDMTTLDDAGRQIAERLNKDSRMLQARAKWGACMQQAGLPFRDPDGVADAIDARARPLYAAKKPGVIPPAAQTLHADEIRVAEIDWDCRKTSITPAYQGVRNELEAAWLDENPEVADRVWAHMSELIAAG